MRLMPCGARSSGSTAISSEAHSTGRPTGASFAHALRSAPVRLVLRCEKRRLRGNGDHFCPLDLIATIETLAVGGRRAYPDAVRAGIQGGLVDHDRGAPDQWEVLLDTRAV